MRILVLSDSHYQKIKLPFNEYDYIFHCGDFGSSYELLINNKINFVKGNCDLKGPKDLNVKINNKKIYITHGDMYNVKSSYNSLIYKAISQNVNICLFGHTHKPEIFILDDIIYLNPGPYMDGFYAVIEDDEIRLHFQDRIYKKINFTW